MYEQEFLNNRIDFMHSRPRFTKVYSDAMGVLERIDKEKSESSKENLKKRFNYLMEEIRKK